MNSKRLNPVPALAALTALALSIPPAGGASLQFNGVNQSVQIADSPSVSPTGPITVEAWINRAASGAQHSVVEKFGCTTGDGGFTLRVTASDRLLFGTRNDCNFGSSVIGSIPIPAHVWTHVAGSWDGATLRVYVNGVLDTTAATTRNPKNGFSPLRIGQRGNGGTFFNGQIDEVRLWSVARTAAQIATNRTVCLTGNEAGLAAYFRLDEGAGATTADATANGNTGALVNGPTWQAAGAFVCGSPPPPPPAPPIFDALEIAPAAVPTALLVVPPPFPGAVDDTTPLPTNGLSGLLPTGSVAHVVMPGGTVLAISTDPVSGTQEFLIDAGGGNLHFVYAVAGAATDPVVVGSIVKAVANRTLAPGPLVAESVRLRTVPVAGFDISAFLLDGVVSQNAAAQWTIGGVPFNIIPATGVTPTSIDPLVNPIVPGVSVVAVLFTPAAGAIVLPPGAGFFDALEIATPAAAVLSVPAPLFRGAVANPTVLPAAFMPPGTIADVALPGAVIVSIRTDSVTGGQEIVADAGGGILVRIYTWAGTVIKGTPAPGVGSVVKIVAKRTLAPGPIVADVITLRSLAVPGVTFSFLYQGVITRADPDVWTIGGVDFNIGGPASATPTSIGLTTPLVLGLTPATVLFSLVPGAALGPPTVQVEAVDALADESGPDPAVMRITRVGINFLPLTVNFTLTGTAINGTDYSAVPLTAFLPVGSNSVEITIQPLADNICEPTETVVLTLTASTNYFLGLTNSATAAIADAGICPPTVTVAATDAAAAEALSDPAVFTLTRTGLTSSPLTVNYTLTGTAVNGTDYTAVPLSVVIPTGASTATVTITPIDDAVFDPNETVILTIAANAAYLVGAPSSATATILDNEVGPPTVTVLATDAAAAEALQNPAVFTLSRSGPTTDPLTVNYTLTGTAVNGTDYTAVPLSVVIPTGASNTTVTITPIDDLVVEPNETVILTIAANAAYVVGAPNSATATIADNDIATNFALQFNGVSQSVQVPDNASVSIIGPITIEAWIRRAATGVQHSIVEKYGCNAGEGGYVLRVTAADKLMFGTRDDCNNGTSVTGSLSIPANVWTHVAGHWDGTAMRVFVNGVQDGAAVFSARNPKDGPTAMKIGERGNGGSPFNGLIDEVRLWSTTRSAAQINANKSVCIPVPTPNLRGYWKLDQAAGTTAADSSGNANTGNLVNGPAHVGTVAPVTCP